jgi:hypothetical protein
MSRAGTYVTSWIEDDAYLEQRPLRRSDGRVYWALSWFSEDHRELVSLYLTVDQAQVLFESLTTHTLTVEEN